MTLIFMLQSFGYTPTVGVVVSGNVPDAAGVAAQAVAGVPTVTGTAFA